MTVRQLETYPSDVLTTKSKPVKEITDEIRKLIADMFDTMYAANGIGLAAPQIGVNLRIAVLDIANSGDQASTGFIQSGKFALINPEITRAEGEIDWEEGCLSVPGFWTVMRRAKKLEVNFLNLEGKKETLKAENLLAVAIQQEIDHLDGKLIIDTAGRLKKNLYVTKIKKQRKKKDSG